MRQRTAMILALLFLSVLGGTFVGMAAPIQTSPIFEVGSSSVSLGLGQSLLLGNNQGLTTSLNWKVGATYSYGQPLGDLDRLFAHTASGNSMRNLDWVGSVRVRSMHAVEDLNVAGIRITGVGLELGLQFREGATDAFSSLRVRPIPALIIDLGS